MTTSTAPGLNGQNASFDPSTAEPKAPAKIKVELYRRDGSIYLQFEVSEVLEKMFQQKSEGTTKQSQSWPGLSFYTVPNLLDSVSYQEMLSNYGLFDDYGRPIVKNGRFNIAFIRTVGGKGVIKLNEEIPFAQASEAVRNMVRAIKGYYRDFVSDYKVTGTVAVEV